MSSELKSIDSTMKDKTKTSMRYSMEKNGVRKSYDVTEVENGFIICVEKSWDDKEKGYQYEEKKYVSKTNPFSKSNEDEMELPDAVSELLSNMNTLSI